MKELLKSGANVHAQDKEKNTPLHLATKHNKLEAVYILLAAGTPVDAADGDTRTSLHWAAANSNVQIAKVLLAYGANCDALCNSQHSPLHIIASTPSIGVNRSIAVIKELLDRGATIHLLDINKKSVLTLALRHNLQNRELIRFLVLNGAVSDPLDRPNLALVFMDFITAVIQGDVEKVHTLVRSRSIPDILEAIPYAIAQGHLGILELFNAILKCDASKSSYPKTKLK